jgi:cytochrome c biogenesis protein CcdA/thiol-disulfide isomerase/thioredoxin
MILVLLSYLGGVLTILSPCILPVLPFVFARAGQPFVRSSLPLLLGMAITFALVATLAAVGGGWAVHANQYGRIAAIVLLGLFGLTLLFPTLSDRLTRPLVALGGRLSQSAGNGQSATSSIVPSFLLGVATGLLWAPCAGPILGLVLTGAALQGASSQTSLLLLAYGLGAATSLALALLIGGRVFAALKRSLGIGEWIRRALGAAVLLGVAAIAFGLDTGALTQLSLASTSGLEQRFLNRLKPASAGDAPIVNATSTLPIEGKLPPLDGAVEWLNSPPLTAESLRGKVVLVDFWTYSCINCLRSLPYVRAWAEKYRDQGLVVIGVHAPEFAFEKNLDNVRKAVQDLGITYPVAIDNNYAIWREFGNQYWPAHYFADAQGNLRYHHFGEGEYEQSEMVIRKLLAEAGHKLAADGNFVSVDAAGVGKAADNADVQSPETYIGYSRAERFAAPGGAIHDQAAAYSTPAKLDLNSWSLSGSWVVKDEKAVLATAPGRITFRFHARDLHLVLGSGSSDKPIRFKLTLDGQAPGENHGVDVDAAGLGSVSGQRLYQLIRQSAQSGDIQDRTFEIEFLDPGVEAFAFTFG